VGGVPGEQRKKKKELPLCNHFLLQAHLLFTFYTFEKEKQQNR